MSEKVPRRLLVALGRAAATEAGGQQGDEWFGLGLVEHVGDWGLMSKTGSTPSDDNADARDKRITTVVILPRGKGNV